MGQVVPLGGNPSTPTWAQAGALPSMPMPGGRRVVAGNRDEIPAESPRPRHWRLLFSEQEEIFARLGPGRDRTAIAAR